MTRSLALLCTALAASCAPARDDDAPWTPEERATILSLSPPGPPPPSPGNRHADDPAAARLGRALFVDPALSAGGATACATCHDPARGFADGRRVARGVAEETRNVPSVAGTAFVTFLSWDGRKDSLWAQSMRPFEDPREMGSHRTEVVRGVAARHREAFEAAFGPLPPLLPAGSRPWEDLAPGEREAITRVFVDAGKALEAFQRRITFPETAFDRYVAALRAGDPEGGGHLAPAARRGLRLFVGRAACVTCHHGPLLTDGEFHNVGLPAEGGPRDPGRADGARAVKADEFRCGTPHSDAAPCDELRYLATDLRELEGAFRTPSLRNVSATAPYMHDGRFATLEEVVAFYKQRPARPAIGERDPLLRTVDRGASTADLVAFLRALDGAPEERAEGR